MIRDALLMRRTDGAMVRVSMTVTTTPEAALKKEVGFLRSLAPVLSRYIPGRGARGEASASRTAFVQEALR